MIPIAIVEDNAAERARIRECLKYVENSEGVVFNVREFQNGLEFLGSLEAPSAFDLVFMDIEMPGMNGMETARALRQTDPTVLLVFITNMAQYAISGYEVDALDFILKPINKYSFAIKMKRALTRIPHRNEDYIAIRSEGETRSVCVDSIRWIDVNGHYVVYHTTDGDITEYSTLKESAARVNCKTFTLANRSCLVNMRFVDAVSKETVTIGNTKLDISRPQRKKFFAAISGYMGGKA